MDPESLSCNVYNADTRKTPTNKLITPQLPRPPQGVASNHRRVLLEPLVQTAAGTHPDGPYIVSNIKTLDPRRPATPHCPSVNPRTTLLIADRLRPSQETWNQSRTTHSTCFVELERVENIVPSPPLYTARHLGTRHGGKGGRQKLQPAGGGGFARQPINIFHSGTITLPRAPPPAGPTARAPCLRRRSIPSASAPHRLRRSPHVLPALLYLLASVVASTEP